MSLEAGAFAPAFFVVISHAARSGIKPPARPGEAGKKQQREHGQQYRGSRSMNVFRSYQQPHQTKSGQQTDTSDEIDGETTYHHDTLRKTVLDE